MFTNILYVKKIFNILHIITNIKSMKTTIMLKKCTYVLVASLLTFTSCKEEVKPSEVEARKEIVSELEKAGLQKKSSNDDEIIAAMNVIYKTPYASLNDENKGVLQAWNDAIGYNGAQDLYDDMFASFNMSEQVASLISEYSEKEYTSVHERDVYNQAVSLLFQKENDEKAYDLTVNTFTEIYTVASKTLSDKGVSIDSKSWNKGMTKNFAEYWYVHSSRILEANARAKTTTLNEFLKREES